MKFKIRFADQIVGVFIILSLVSLAAVIILLGRSQRWFSDDVSYYTILPSATGLSKNMPVHYKGFAIGSIKKFDFTDGDDVRVDFVINEEYNNRVKEGSLVEMMVSPIGLGNQFLLHSGTGSKLLDKGSMIPMVGSAQARNLINQGLATEPYHDDSITLIMNKISSILANADEILGQGNEMLADLRPALADLVINLEAITAMMKKPDSLVSKVMDGNGDVYVSLAKSLTSLSSILDNLDKTTASQFPQVAGIIMELRSALKSADDVMTALTNNPLLKKGIPEKVEGQSGGSSPRNIQF